MTFLFQTGAFYLLLVFYGALWQQMPDTCCRTVRDCLCDCVRGSVALQPGLSLSTRAFGRLFKTGIMIALLISMFHLCNGVEGDQRNDAQGDP
jgi:hypothetical protein